MRTKPRQKPTVRPASQTNEKAALRLGVLGGLQRLGRLGDHVSIGAVAVCIALQVMDQLAVRVLGSSLDGSLLNRASPRRRLVDGLQGAAAATQPPGTPMPSSRYPLYLP